MSDAPAPVPEATVTARTRRFSLIWLIPLGTAVIAAYLVVDTIRSRGPTVTVTFQSGEGLQPGKSVVKQKDVDMGTVKTVTLSDDAKSVVVTIEMKPQAERLLNDSTQFWVVKARFFAGAVQGLDTLLSGAYLEMRPGRVGGDGKRDYVGLEDPPVLTSDTPGRTVLVHADRIGSINLGSPVFYRGLVVGSVLGYDIGDMARDVTLHVFVRDPFDRYVHDNSRFWNASGFSANLTGSGLQLQVESLRAVLLGGVAFETPDGGQPLTDQKPQQFTLYKDQDTAIAASFGRQVEFVAYFEGSVRGLGVGAEVELRGIKIGQVTDVSLRYDAAQDRVVVPVRFVVQPERIAQSQMSGDIPRQIAEFVRRGMRAQLVNGNLITGAQLVTLDIVPDAPPAEMGMEGDVIVVPTLRSGGFENLARSASDILAKVNAIPFEQIGQHLDQTLSGVNQIVGGPQLKQAIVSLDAALRSVRDVGAKLDSGLTPALDRLPAVASGLQDSVARVNKLLATAEASYGGDSRFHADLTDTLSQLDDTARAVRALADLLTRHPEALVRGRPERGIQ